MAAHGGERFYGPVRAEAAKGERGRESERQWDDEGWQLKKGETE